MATAVEKYGWTAVALVGLGLSLLVAWAGDTVLPTGPASAPLSALALAALLGGSALGLLLWHYRRQQRQASRCLEALAQLGPQDLFSDTSDATPPLPATHPQAQAIGRLREALSAHLRRIQELEHVRAALEVRCRRALAQYEQIKAIFSHLAEPIVVVDDYNELLLANRSAQELFGFETGKAEDRALAKLVQCQRLVDLLAGTVSRKAPGARTEELEITDPQGRKRWYRATAVKLSAGEGAEQRGAGAASGAVAVLRDIGDHKALQKRNAEFVSAVSHEMKTPLAGIKAYVELLADGEAEDRATQEEFLQLISGQADRLQRLVENLLNIARIEAGVVNVNKQPRSLNEILEEALRLVRPSAEAKNIQLLSELSPMYLGVLADRDLLLQAALNLLSNAVKYTPQGGKVILRSQTDGQHIRFEVQDTGVGLSEEDCQRVFEKFYRVKKDRDMAPGTGLGLPLAKHIIEDVHGGTITVQSKLGEGSTFAVVLPRAGQSL